MQTFMNIAMKRLGGANRENGAYPLLDFQLPRPSRQLAVPQLASQMQESLGADVR